MRKDKVSAKRDWGLIITYLSVISVFFGSTLIKLDVAVFQLYPLRLFGFIGFFLIIFRKGWPDNFLDGYYKFSMFFLILGLSSIIWAPDTVLAIKEFGILQTGIALTWLIIRYINTEDKINTVIYIWILGALFVNLIGLWEVATQRYLITTELGSKTERLAMRVGYLAPRSIFANQNNYAFFNSLTCLILLGKVMKQYRPFIWYALNWLSLGLSLYILISSYSRAAIASFSLGVFLFIVFTIFSHNNYKNSLIKFVVALFILFIGVLLFKTSLIDSLLDKLYLVVEKNDASTNDDRVNFLTISLDYALDHLGIGMGPGSSAYPLGGIEPHNFFVQVLVEYGIIIVIGILLVLFKAVKRLNSYQNVIANAMPPMVKASIIAFPIMAVGPSSIMGEGVFWLWFGFLIAYSSVMFQKYRTLYLTAAQRELTV